MDAYFTSNIAYLEKEINKLKTKVKQLNNTKAFSFYMQEITELEANLMSFKRYKRQQNDLPNIYIPDRIFTLEELQTKYNGQNGNPCYVAFRGIVFNASRIAAWAGGTHFNLSCGSDVTEEATLCGYHVPKEIMTKLPAVGRLSADIKESSNTTEVVARCNPINHSANKDKCPLIDSKHHVPINYIKMAIDRINEGNIIKPNCIWLETSSCFGEIIALLDGENPSLVTLLSDMVNMTFFNSINGEEGEVAFQKILDTINADEPYIFIVSGAIPLRSDGKFSVVANYEGQSISAAQAVKIIAPKASYVIAAGTCAAFGGPTAARPNLSEAVPVSEVIDKPVINAPGCPIHPLWILGTLAHIINFGMPELDNLGTPTTFYSVTIHDRCPRRSFFDSGIFASAFGQIQCMFRLGCRGPVTKTLCPFNRWNDSNNWPIGDNTNCIGCASFGFPDLTEPFVRY